MPKFKANLYESFVSKHSGAQGYKMSYKGELGICAPSFFFYTVLDNSCKQTAVS